MGGYGRVFVMRMGGFHPPLTHHPPHGDYFLTGSAARNPARAFALRHLAYRLTS